MKTKNLKIRVARWVRLFKVKAIVIRKDEIICDSDWTRLMFERILGRVREGHVYLDSPMAAFDRFPSDISSGWIEFFLHECDHIRALERHGFWKCLRLIIRDFRLPHPKRQLESEANDFGRLHKDKSPVQIYNILNA